MNDISSKQKLELVRQLRSKHSQNQSDLFQREQILYGRTGVRTAEQSYDDNIIQPEQESYAEPSSFRIRLALAGVILLSIILLDRSGKSFAGISMEQVFSSIAVDYGQTMEVWAESLVDYAPIDSPAP